MEPTDEIMPEVGLSGEALTVSPPGLTSIEGWVDQVRSQPEQDPGPLTEQDRRRKGKRAWGLLDYLAVATVVFWGAAISWMGFEAVQSVPPTPRSVRGSVVDSLGNPQKEAIVFVASTPEKRVKTGTDGSFELVELPHGPQNLVVAVGRIGQEFPIPPDRSGAIDLSVLRYVAPPDL